MNNIFNNTKSYRYASKACACFVAFMVMTSTAFAFNVSALSSNLTEKAATSDTTCVNACMANYKTKMSSCSTETIETKKIQCEMGAKLTLQQCTLGCAS